MMKCYYHPDREPVGMCVNCGRLICTECKREHSTKLYCAHCSDELLKNTQLIDSVPRPRDKTETAPEVSKPEQEILKLTATNKSGQQSNTDTGQRCPKCGLINPTTALVCDCGYNFITHGVDKTLAPKAKRNETKEQDKRKTWKPTVAGFSLILAAFTSPVFIQVIYGLTGAAIAPGYLFSILLPGMGAWCAFRRKSRGWAIAGSVAACLVMPLFGILALVLLLNSKNEFATTPSITTYTDYRNL